MKKIFYIMTLIGCVGLLRIIFKAELFWEEYNIFIFPGILLIGIVGQLVLWKKIKLDYN
ncbi:hypothetical protein [Risungbinella massiliensis]|uniref:hypothetical protein n=1 Tax=Risungbinella massiliensis TaxID=1329796 RepID=UPI0012B5F031|nr:hypothetical protein [Risungbinella massiliensis]